MVNALQQAAASKEEADESLLHGDAGYDGSKDEESVDWGEAKRLLEEITQNDKDKVDTFSVTVRGGAGSGSDDDGGSEEDGGEGEDEEVDYHYADDFEEYEDLEEESCTLGGTSATASSTLRGEGIVDRGADDLSEGSATLRVEGKETDSSASAAFEAVSPSWKVKSLHTSHSNDKTLGSSALLLFIVVIIIIYITIMCVVLI